MTNPRLAYGTRVYASPDLLRDKSKTASAAMNETDIMDDTKLARQQKAQLKIMHVSEAIDDGTRIV